MLISEEGSSELTLTPWVQAWSMLFTVVGDYPDKWLKISSK